MNSERRILIVAGTRPEAIKLLPVYQAFQRSRLFDTALCVTAQHRQMLDQVLSVFGVTPDFDLDVMGANQDLFDVTSKALAGMKSVLSSFRPDWVIVQGDTTTTFAASLAAFYQRIAVAHVEAGLRTGRKYEPWPEEINRKMSTAIADLHFAPTAASQRNLLRENVEASRIHVTGNTVIDALCAALDLLERNQQMRAKVDRHLPPLAPDRKMILVTAHRRENFGAGLDGICGALRRLVEMFPDVELVFPVHPNPHVREPVFRALRDSSCPALERVHLIEPAEYLSFVHLLQRAYLVISDSGGVQEESSWLRKPLLIMRDTTERPEVVEAGAARLVGTEPDRILREVSRLLQDREAYEAMRQARDLYGDGTASDQILRILQGS